MGYFVGPQAIGWFVVLPNTIQLEATRVVEQLAFDQPMEQKLEDVLQSFQIRV